MAEIELSVLCRERLDRRIPDAHTATQQVADLDVRRCNGATVELRFTSGDARLKLDQPDPSSSA